MPLNPSLMLPVWLPLAQNWASSVPDAARIAADGYEAYAKLGLAQTYLPILTGSEKKHIEVALLQVWNAVESATKEATAAAWYSGISKFWMSPPVLFGPTAWGPGITIAPPAGSAVSCIIGSTQNSGTSQPPLLRLANCLHSATAGIVLANIPQPPFGVPAPFPVV